MATSRAVIGFWLVHALRLPGGLGPAMEELLSLVRAGRLQPPSSAAATRWPRPPAAHQDLRARRTTGKLVLDVRWTAVRG